MNAKERLTQIPTDLLIQWIADVRQVLHEYQEGTHSSSRCKHCFTAMEQRRRRPAVKDACTLCIWFTMCNRHCTTLPRNRLDSWYSSGSVSHNKKVHIARCVRWLKLLIEELSNRGDTCE